jgi:hypothetical protein
MKHSGQALFNFSIGIDEEYNYKYVDIDIDIEIDSEAGIKQEKTLEIFEQIKSIALQQEAI